MKKLIKTIVFSIGIFNFAIAENLQTTTHTFAPQLDLKVEIQNGVIFTQWTKYSPPEFLMYKILRSTTEKDPTPNKNNLIKQEINPDATIFIDNSPLPEEAYYRVCTTAGEVNYCSNVVKVSPISVEDITKYSNEKYIDWKNRCTEWNGRIEEPNLCHWENGLWADAVGLYSGVALELFDKYGDPRPENARNIDDISGTNYAEAIFYLKNKNIVQGYPDGSFRPQQKINRAEFTKIIMQSTFPNKEITENCFNDVTNQWFAQYICLAKTKNIINGYADNTFRPSQNINFAEASKIISNAFGITPTADGSSEWYSRYITTLKNQKYIPITIKSPEQEISREEMAELIWRVLEDIRSKPSW